MLPRELGTDWAHRIVSAARGRSAGKATRKGEREKVKRRGALLTASNSEGCGSGKARTKVTRRKTRKRRGRENEQRQNERWPRRIPRSRALYHRVPSLSGRCSVKRGAHTNTPVHLVSFAHRSPSRRFHDLSYLCELGARCCARCPRASSAFHFILPVFLFYFIFYFLFNALLQWRPPPRQAASSRPTRRRHIYTRCPYAGRDSLRLVADLSFTTRIILSRDRINHQRAPSA